MNTIWDAVFSELGFFILASGTSCVLVAISLSIAYQQSQYVTGIPDRVTFRGRKPIRAKSIKRRLDVVKGFRSQLLARILLSLVIVILAGVVVPGGALLLLLVQAVALFPESPMFVAGGACSAKTAVSSPAVADVAGFVLAQSYSALALDSFHGIMKPPVTRISGSESSILVSTLIASYKLYLGGYAGNWVRTVAYGLFNVLFRGEENKAQIKELQDQYDAAVSRESGD